jgi:hypothetical protein
MLLLALIFWFLNLGISIWNAYAVGTAWVETKHAGGWPRFMAWMGAMMSALGFTWCYALFAAFVLGAMGKLDETGVEGVVYLGYLIVVPGILFSGVMIMIDSWSRAYRKRTVANVGVAGYNTFANAYNAYNAVRTVPLAWEKVMDALKPKNKDSAQAFLIILVVIVALGCGIITTWVIVSRIAARDQPLPVAGGYPQYAGGLSRRGR